MGWVLLLRNVDEYNILFKSNESRRYKSINYNAIYVHSNAKSISVTLKQFETTKSIKFRTLCLTLKIDATKNISTVIRSTYSSYTSITNFDSLVISRIIKQNILFI